MTAIITTLERERLERRQQRLDLYWRLANAILTIAVGAICGIAITLVILDLSFLIG